MSRSRRKPIITDGYKSKWKQTAKRNANKRVRSTDNIADGAAYKRTYDSWSICDYKFDGRFDDQRKPWIQRAKRK